MQKVVGSSPIIRFHQAPAQGAFSFGLGVAPFSLAPGILAPVLAAAALVA
jgi:hypothetical protein